MILMTLAGFLAGMTLLACLVAMSRGEVPYAWVMFPVHALLWYAGYADTKAHQEAPRD